MTISAKEAKLKYAEKNKKSVKIEQFEFTYKSLGGKQQMRLGLGSAGKGEEELLTDLIFEAVIGWKGVKVKDVFDDFDQAYGEEEIVGFDSELFDAFVGKNLTVIQELFTFIVEDLNKKTIKEEQEVELSNPESAGTLVG